MMNISDTNIITEDYVSYEIAVLLKDKGFDVPVRFEYHCIYNVNQKPQFHKKLHNFNGVEYSGLTSKWYSAPSQSLALKWLREVHNICITIDGYPTIDGNFEFKPRIFNSTGKYWEDWHLSYKVWFNSYEEAVEAACLYVLKNLL